MADAADAPGARASGSAAPVPCLALAPEAQAQAQGSHAALPTDAALMDHDPAAAAYWAEHQLNETLELLVLAGPEPQPEGSLAELPTEEPDELGEDAEEAGGPGDDMVEVRQMLAAGVSRRVAPGTRTLYAACQRLWAVRPAPPRRPGPRCLGSEHVLGPGNV